VFLRRNYLTAAPKLHLYNIDIHEFAMSESVCLAERQANAQGSAASTSLTF
jgi:hypothetical protein